MKYAGNYKWTTAKIYYLNLNFWFYYLSFKKIKCFHFDACDNSFDFFATLVPN